MSRPILVTGATGFLGRHILVANAARENALPMLALVRSRDAWKRSDWLPQAGAVETVEGSVLEPERWSDALPPLGGIVHLAALVQHSRFAPEPMWRTNVEGTLAMLRLAARHDCRIVVASTTGTVGCFRSPHESADEKSPGCERTIARWPYYRSKLELERRARALADEQGVELVLMRPPVLLGPGDHRFRSTSNVWKALQRKLPFLVPGGMHFADVRDAAAAFLAALERPAVQPVYHLPGHACTIQEFFALVEEVSGVPAPRFVLPPRLARLAASLVEGGGARLFGQPPHWLPDPVVVEMASHHWGARSLYAEHELGYRSRDPRETLRDTVAWMRENHPAAGGREDA